MRKKIIFILLIFSIFNACTRHEFKSAILENPNDELNITLERFPSTNEDNWNPGNGWNLAWKDEFNEIYLNTNNWSFQVEPAGRFNNEWQRYTDSRSNCYIYYDNEIKNGYMVIEAKYNGNGLKMGNFTSARMITHGKKSFRYGKIAARIQVPYGQGIWPAFWMLGSNIDENSGGTTPWPQCGEIDIMEKVGGGEKEKELHGTIHYFNTSKNGHDDIGGSTKIKENLSDNFHVYEIEWNENEIIWLLDGDEYHRQDIRDSDFDAFRKDFYILLNVAVGGVWPGYPDNTTTFPQYMFIDWIRYYTK